MLDKATPNVLTGMWYWDVHAWRACIPLPAMVSRGTRTHLRPSPTHPQGACILDVRAGARVHVPAGMPHRGTFVFLVVCSPIHALNCTRTQLPPAPTRRELLTRVVDRLRSDLPSVRTFVTLSPVPGFSRWLRSRWDLHQQSTRAWQGGGRDEEKDSRRPLGQQDDLHSQGADRRQSQRSGQGVGREGEQHLLMPRAQQKDKQSQGVDARQLTNISERPGQWEGRVGEQSLPRTGGQEQDEMQSQETDGRQEQVLLDRLETALLSSALPFDHLFSAALLRATAHASNGDEMPGPPTTQATSQSSIDRSTSAADLAPSRRPSPSDKAKEGTPQPEGARQLSGRRGSWDGDAAATPQSSHVWSASALNMEPSRGRSPSDTSSAPAAAAPAELHGVLTALLARYLLLARGRERDPVAGFHLRNGARLARIHWAANSAEYARPSLTLAAGPRTSKPIGILKVKEASQTLEIDAPEIRLPVTPITTLKHIRPPPPPRQVCDGPEYGHDGQL
jgi:hypothetical protein